MNTPTTSEIRAHYDRLSIFYRWLWGEHIHHGLWRDSESPRQAQVALVEELARCAAVPFGARVLDVGCGLGASAHWLAQNRGCSVVGITISTVQKRAAERRARSLGLKHRMEFLVKDANKLDFGSESFDVVWNIECSEHLNDKAQFIRDSARVLRHGGALALCAWVKAADSKLLPRICSGMLCPALATLADYHRWMNESGLARISSNDVTAHVEKTWHICRQTIDRPLVRICLPFVSRQTRRFLATFETMKQAYDDGALRYCIFSASKP